MVRPCCLQPCLHLSKRCRRDICCLPARPRRRVFCSQAARILANLIVAGAGVLLRAGAQAYRQALVSAPRGLSSRVRCTAVQLRAVGTLSVCVGASRRCTEVGRDA